MQRALLKAPREPHANELMAYVAGRTGDLAGALRHLLVATASPAAPDTAWYYLGTCYAQQSMADEAREAFERALQINSQFFEARHDLGRVLHEQGRYPQALVQLEQAIALRPSSYEAHHNAARALSALHRYGEALERYERAVTLDGSVPETWMNRGEVLHDLGRFADALESYDRALQLRPAYSEARANKAITLLTLGHFEPGWQLFEHRWTGGLQKRHQEIPPWTGEPDLAGKRILVWCEQGMGDTVQFSRYLPRLAEMGGEVVFEAQPDVAALMRDSFPFEVVAMGKACPQADLQAPLMSLPRLLACPPIPAHVPYLAADGDLVSRWKERLRAPRDMPTVALACSGSVSYKYENRRRIPLEHFAALSKTCHLVLAQRDLRPEDREAIDSGAVRATFVGDDMKDFRDAAAIAMACDAVLSIDTSLAHVAGALARPTLVMLADVSDWRWMSGRDRSPWYPTAEIHRQAAAGEWSEVVQAVHQRVQELYAAGAHHRAEGQPGP